MKPVLRIICEMVRETVEETLNALLDMEAVKLSMAGGRLAETTLPRVFN